MHYSSYGIDSTSSTYTDSSTIWSFWVEGNYMASYTTTSSTANDVWYRWVEDTTSYSGYYTGDSDMAWERWVEQDYENVEISQHSLSIDLERTEKELKKADKERKEAEKLAKELLLELIGPDQMEIYKKTGRLLVKGTKYDYMLNQHGSIKRIEKDKITDLCVHLKNKHIYPVTDNIISLLLAIKADEDKILELAHNNGSKPLPEKLPKHAVAS